MPSPALRGPQRPHLSEEDGRLAPVPPGRTEQEDLQRVLDVPGSSVGAGSLGTRGLSVLEPQSPASQVMSMSTPQQFCGSGSHDPSRCQVLLSSYPGGAGLWFQTGFPGTSRAGAGGGGGGRPGEDRMEGPRFLSASIRPITQVPPESLGILPGGPHTAGYQSGAE